MKIFNHKILYVIGITLSILQAEEQLTSSQAHGLAFMVPEERWAIRIESRHMSYDKFYNDRGRGLKVGSELNKISLSGEVIPVIGLYGPEATLGETSMDMELSGQRHEITLGYGVTKDLTVGATIPFGEVRTRVNFSLSGGNVGTNPYFDPTQTVGAANMPFAPVAYGAEPLGTAGIKKVLTDPAYGYGYKSFSTTTTNGLVLPALCYHLQKG